jgi:uncharacterized protein (TIGR03083 family)
MDESEVWRAIDEQRSQLADLFEAVAESEWRTPSLCADWTVRDVAAHLTLAQMPLSDATLALLRARGSFNVMIRDTARRQAVLPVEEFPRRIRAMVGSRRTAPFITELEPLIDVLVHAQDVARPLGRDYPMPITPAMAAADRVWARPFPFRPRAWFAGFELVATDAPWRVGSGRLVEAPMAAILLLLTGRRAGLNDVSGPVAAELATRLPNANVVAATRRARSE